MHVFLENWKETLLAAFSLLMVLTPKCTLILNLPLEKLYDRYPRFVCYCNNSGSMGGVMKIVWWWLPQDVKRQLKDTNKAEKAQRNATKEAKRHAKYNSPFRRFVRELWRALREEQATAKALRQIKQLEWSTDYLVYLLKKAGNESVQIKIENSGMVLTLSNVKDNKPKVAAEMTQEELYRQYMGFGDN